MTQTPDTIRRHANGSIDTGHYIRQAHVLRSDDAHKALRTAKRSALAAAVALPTVLVVSLVVLLPFGAGW